VPAKAGPPARVGLLAREDSLLPQRDTQLEQARRPERACQPRTSLPARAGSSYIAIFVQLRRDRDIWLSGAYSIIISQDS